jgi:two-component system, cell cycle response regulator
VAGGTTRLVLNVDDRPPSLYVRRHILRMNGYAVADAANGRDAWSAALRLRPTAILMDVHLPDADGRLLCREMQNDADLKSIPIVLISATLTSTDVPDPREWGAAEFLREPIAPATLAATMRRVLARGRLAE